MEKRRPHHDLARFKDVCGDPARLGMTVSAFVSAAALGFDEGAVARLIRSMAPRMFYKSMTSFADHARWQDVYHVPDPAGRVIYLKFTDDGITEFRVLSFKER